MDNFPPFSSPENRPNFPYSGSQTVFSQADYSLWLHDLRPRTCLLVNWLCGLGAIHDPGARTHGKAQRFAQKRNLLGALVEGAGGDVRHKTDWLLENAEFDLYVTYLMWLRFNEYVPRRFVAPEGRAKVLRWVRLQLNRPELTDAETVVELGWQIERIRSEMGDYDGWREELES